MKIFEAGTLIGNAKVVALDPPMGVVNAKFEPTPAYCISRHANIVDGEYITDHGVGLRIELQNAIGLECIAICIHDCPILGEIEVDIIGTT